MKRAKSAKPFAVVDRRGRYAKKLAELRGRAVSGIYAIADKKTKRVLYVGESHTQNLYDTITRHFRKWERPRTLKYAGGRTRGGKAFDRRDVLICWTITPAAKAQALQYAEIQRLKPPENEVLCDSERCATRHAARAAARVVEDVPMVSDVAPF